MAPPFDFKVSGGEIPQAVSAEPACGIREIALAQSFVCHHRQRAVNALVEVYGLFPGENDDSVSLDLTHLAQGFPHQDPPTDRLQLEAFGEFWIDLRLEQRCTAQPSDGLLERVVGLAVQLRRTTAEQGIDCCWVDSQSLGISMSSRGACNFRSARNTA